LLDEGKLVIHVVSWEILTEGERRGINHDKSNKREMQGFNNFVESLEVVDIPCIDENYTWYRPNGKAKSRLDRFLTSFEWLQHWPYYMY